MARMAGEALVALAAVTLAIGPLAVEAIADDQPSPAAAKHGTDASGRPKEYADGVRIDWQRRFVELDARVVLREGPLELLACSPITREHESILTVRARPRDVFHALGLLGVEPGSPPVFDPRAERTLPARGESLDIRIRCDAPGHEKPVAATRWLKDNQTGKALDAILWVFSGSRSTAEGRFLADMEGTVICVVDFDTAVISPATSHTSDNNALWLSANTEAIPPVGTACILSIQSLERSETHQVELDDRGRTTFEGRVLEPAEIARMIVQRAEAR